MFVSDCNPVQFWVLTTPQTFPLNWSSSALQITFNRKPKNNRTIQVKCYYHVLKSFDSFPIEFQVDNPGHVYSIRSYYKDSSFFQQWVATQLYDNQFVATIDLSISESSIRNKLLGFAIIDETSHTILAITDLCAIQPDPDPSIQLLYQNDIEEDGVSTQSQFAIRIPASFFRGRFPEEIETMETTDGKVNELTGSTKEQRLLDIQHIPDYIIRKLKKILKFRDKFIDGQRWAYEESLEPKDGSAFFEFRRCSCYLTLDNSIVRNVYSLTTTTTTTTTTSTTTSTTSTTTSTTTSSTTTSTTTTTTTSTTSTTQVPNPVEMEISGFTGGLQWRSSWSGATLTVNSTSPTSQSGSIPFLSSASVTVRKLSNSGITQDNGSIVFKQNGATMHTEAFSLGDNYSSGTGYTFTSVSPGDTLRVEVFEG